MQIESALIADYAEVNGTKLYVMGGGWEAYRAREAPAQLRMAVALGIRLEWSETNQPIPVHIRIDDEDGAEIIRAQGSLNVGRPAHLPAGSTQLAQLAVNLGVRLPRFGGYRVEILAGEGEAVMRRELPFRLLEQR